MPKKNDFDWKRFNRQCAGDEREYTPEEEKQIKKEALKEVALLKSRTKKTAKFNPAEQILTKLYNGAIYEQREKALHAKLTNDDLLEIDDWTRVTPETLQQHINRGEVVDWCDGYDSGPSPLTNALQQGASSEIIAMLIANGANVDTPTVLPSGTKVTPLEIVRLQPATHDNLQKELILLRAGAKDDVLTWLRQHKTEKPLDFLFGRGACLRKKLRFLGYNAGEKIFQCGGSYMYIKQKADGIRYDADFEIYDKGVDRLNPFSGPEPEWLNSELGDKFAKLFFAECGKMSPNVAMHEYYSYLSSLYWYAGNKVKESRIRSAEHDLRNNYFTKKDWQNLIAITHNITAKAEYSKMMKKAFAEGKRVR